MASTSTWKSWDAQASSSTPPQPHALGCRTPSWSDAASLLLDADLDFAAKLGVRAMPGVAGLRRCVSRCQRLLGLPAFGSLASGREVEGERGTVMRVWTDDGFEATYETAQLHAKYLAGTSVDQRYDVVANYTVCIVVDFLNRVDGACLAGFAMCPRGSGGV
jgi:hypothetical protein